MGKECAPREKLGHLRAYAARYWNFVCRQAIKLRKLESLNTNTGTTTASNTTASGVADLSTILETVDLNQHHLNDTSMFMSASAFLQHNETTTTTTSNPRTSLGGVYVDYFVTYDEKSPRLSSESSGQATRRSTMAYPVSQSMRLADFKFWDALIHVGALNLIYTSIQDARGVVNAGFVPGQVTRKLDDALEWFNIMDAEESNQQPAREYTKYELEVTNNEKIESLSFFFTFL